MQIRIRIQEDFLNADPCGSGSATLLFGIYNVLYDLLQVTVKSRMTSVLEVAAVQQVSSPLHFPPYNRAHVP